MSNMQVQGLELSTTTIVSDEWTCWICSDFMTKRTKNKVTGLCFWCHSKLLNRVIRENRRARKKGNEATLTIAQWANKVQISQGYCHYCHTYIGYLALVMEHILPIAYGGGTTHNNVVPSCACCNSQKCREDYQKLGKRQ